MFTGPDEYFYFCDAGQCKGNMTIKEGEKCVISDDSDNYIEYLYASMQCEKGLGCVPNERGGLEWTCQKVTTKKGEKNCSGDSDCPLDSICECNDENGVTECIPIPTSSMELMSSHEKVQNSYGVCLKKYEGEQKLLECIVDESKDFYELIVKEFYYFDSSVRCTIPTKPKLSSESSSTPSPPIYYELSSSSSSSSTPPPPIYHESSSSPSEPSLSSSSLVPSPTKYAEIEFKKSGMKKDEVDELVKPYIPNGEKYEITITEEKDGKTKAVVEFSNPSAAERFVESLEASSGSAKSLVTSIKYLDKKPTSSASVVIPSFSVLVAAKFLFFLLK